MTHLTFFNLRRNFGAVISKARDSGVVISMCGGCLSILALSVCVVSPVLTRALISGISIPSSITISLMPLRGGIKFLLMSLSNALRGDTYTAYTSSLSVPLIPILTNSSIMARKAARVFPVPVGEEISTFSPFFIAGIAIF